MLATSFLTALALSAGGHAILLSRARRRGTPGRGALPVALALAVVVVGAAAGGHRLAAGVTLGVAGFAAVGLAQDRRPLPAGTRLLCLAALGAGAVLLTVLTDGPAVWGLTQWVVVSVVGAACLLAYAAVLWSLDGAPDASDGAAPMSAVLLGLVVALLAHNRNDVTLVIAGLALAGAAGGLLPWHATWRRAQLGAAGSYGLGALGPLLLLDSWLRGAALLACAGPVLLFAADAVWTAVRRVRRGEPWHADARDHVRQRLVRHGVDPVVSAVVMTGFAAVVAGLVVLASGAGLLGAPLLFVATAVLTLYLALPELTDHLAANAALAPESQQLDLTAP